MLVFFLNNIEAIMAATGALVSLALFILYRQNLIDKGYEKAEKEIKEANIQALKSAKQTGEEIKNLADSELRKRSEQWLRKPD